MVAKVELNKALEACSQYKPAIRSAHYNPEGDELTLDTPWGKLTLPRADIPIFRDVPPSRMRDMYISHTGLHIDELDLDVSSAGLLEEIFRELGQSLSNWH